ncbi:MAG TPA: MBL fold metallo-hydrolase [Allosphingosinicella sp.]|jgi:glyoxylase-like metal-dependent hydrolase (beta-lactamase superfamily II)
MRRIFAPLAVLLVAACNPAPATANDWHLVPGSFEANRGPDGNSIFLDAPDGLILVDTGRHPAHRDRLLGYAVERGRPIIAVINSHWHLDHSTGNAEIRAAYPRAELYATEAVEGALIGFFPQSRAAAERFLASGEATREQRAEMERAFAVMDNPDSLRPSRPISESTEIAIGGRRLRLNVAHFAATEADIWIHDPSARLIVAGDLVVAPVPFMDTACPEGWRRALDEIAATPFTTLIPGHGEPMDRARFLSWRTAFNNFLDCGASERPRDECTAGWVRDAAAFIAPGDEDRMRQMAGYYIDTRLRSSPEERHLYCRPLAGS